MSVAAFIACQRAEYGVPHALACRALGVSESWFYKWRDRPPTARQRRRQDLADRIAKIFAESGGTYGSPRVAPNLLWRGDLTESSPARASCTWPTRWTCSAASAWATRSAPTTTRPGGSGAADGHRQPGWPGRGGDVSLRPRQRGEYTAAASQAACPRQGIIQPMARVGSALDNAVSEAFNSTIKVEYIHRHRFATRRQARTQISNWITGFYNARRRHSACDGMSPPTTSDT